MEAKVPTGALPAICSSHLILNRRKIRRSGNDLHLKADLDLYTAVLGGELVIDTLSGKVKLNIKPETQNGKRSKVKRQRVSGL
jgi:DnaJ-class molecular chaperone